MKKTFMLVALVALLALSIVPAASAAGNGNVVGTFTLADLGQGLWGGGALFADGSAGGNIPFSALNGQLVFNIQPVNWFWLVPNQVVALCFNVVPIKGTPFATGYSCAGLLVTGGPVNVGDFIMRLHMN